MGTMTTIEIKVEGMTCQHCERAITTELTKLPEVQEVRVDIPTGKVWLSTGVAAPSAEDVANAVIEAGFTLVSGPAPEA